MTRDRDPVAAARELVLDLFPDAVWALVTGSVVTRHRTEGSDLDIVVLLPDGDRRVPHRDSRHHRGWPAELFVHDGQTLYHYLTKDAAARRPIMQRMVATGTVVVGDPGEWPARCAAVLRSGPAPLSPDERRWLRYSLTDQLDDLNHATDAGEATTIAAHTWLTVAQHALALADHWRGGGKWLLRELRDLDTGFADRWLAAHGDPKAITAIADEVLGRHGGPLFDGYRAMGERPTR